MCDIVEEYAAEREARGEARGETRGEIRGELKGNLKTLKNIITKQNWSPEKALDFMGIEKSEYPRYLAML